MAGVRAESTRWPENVPDAGHGVMPMVIAIA
jgi:hypothetical protein